MIVNRTPPPPTPKPRNFLAHPKAYGQYADVKWNPDMVATHPDAATAARWQHRIAVQARVALQMSGITQEDFARQMGREKQYLADRINGHRWMSLPDAAFLANRLGVHVIQPEANPRRVPVDRRTPPQPLA